MQYITHFQIDGRHSTRHHISRTPEPQQQGLLAPNHPKFLAEHEKSLLTLPTEIPVLQALKTATPFLHLPRIPWFPHGSPWFPMVPRMVSIKGSNLVAQVYHVVPCCTMLYHGTLLPELEPTTPKRFGPRIVPLPQCSIQSFRRCYLILQHTASLHR